MMLLPTFGQLVMGRSGQKTYGNEPSLYFPVNERVVTSQLAQELKDNIQSTACNQGKLITDLNICR